MVGGRRGAFPHAPRPAVINELSEGNQMNFQSSMGRLASTEGVKLAKITVMLPIKSRIFSQLLEATRKGAGQLSPKVWKPEILLAYCDQLDTAKRVVLGSVATGLQCSAWIAFAKMAAVLMATDDRELLAWVCRSCEILAGSLNAQAPTTAEILQRVADDLKVQLGVENCACDTCVAVAGIKATEAAIDATAHTLEEYESLMAQLRRDANALIASIMLDVPVVATGSVGPESKAQMSHGRHELN